MKHEFKPFEKVLVRDTDNGTWILSLFSNKQEGNLPYVCINSVGWMQCIPYEGNECLLGTADDPTPPKQKFKFGDKVEYKDGGFFESQKTWKHAIYIGFNHNKNTHILLTSQCVKIGEDLNQAKLLEGNGEIRHADW